MPEKTFDRLRVRRLLQAMTAEACGKHPEWPIDIVFGHIDGALQILNDTKTFTYDERLAIVRDEYDVCHASD